MGNRLSCCQTDDCEGSCCTTTEDGSKRSRLIYNSSRIEPLEPTIIEECDCFDCVEGSRNSETAGVASRHSYREKKISQISATGDDNHCGKIKSSDSESHKDEDKAQCVYVTLQD